MTPQKILRKYRVSYNVSSRNNQDGMESYWVVDSTEQDVVKCMEEYATQQCAEKDKEIEKLKELLLYKENFT
jgi:hypothetical protein